MRKPYFRFAYPGRTASQIAIAIVCCLVLAAGAGLYLLFGWNHFSMTMELGGKDSVLLEYGDEYHDAGCRAILKGDRLWRSGVPFEIPVSVSGLEEFTNLGKHTIQYSVDFYGFRNSVERTVRVIDTQVPVITLTPDPADLAPAREYKEAGFQATDNFDGDITDRVKRTEEEGRITYAVFDSSGNPAYAFREIPVFDITPPEIELVGGETYTIPVGQPFVDPGYRAFDAHDGDLTDLVEVQSEEIIWYQPGNYQIKYTVSDKNENTCTITRQVIVEAKEHPVQQYPDGKVIYLTFDDGPCPDTVRLLNILKQYDVKATFFVVNTGYPEIMKRIAAEGHSLAIHTMSHNYDAIYESPEAYYSDLLGMQDVIRSTVGQDTWLMRFPGGSSNMVSSFSPGIMTLLTKSVEDAGFSYFDWNVDSNDAGGATKADTVFKNVIDGVQQNRISVVLQHDIHPYSVDAVEKIILWGKRNGYTFLPLEQNSPSMHHPINN